MPRSPIRGRFDEMAIFFGDVGEGHAAGVWADMPRGNVGFPEKYESRSKPRPGSAKPRR